MLSATRLAALGVLRRGIKTGSEYQHISTKEQVLDLVKNGFTDGDKYDRHRPDYVPQTVDKIVDMLLESPLISSETKRPRCILELGAGTGKFTRHLPQRLPEDVKFIASEPMSDFITTLRKGSPGVEARQFSAESIPLPDSSVQGVVAAQCFHWFANRRAADEITRVLKPGGNLGLYVRSTAKVIYGQEKLRKKEKPVLLWNVKDMKVNWINSVINRIYRDLPEQELRLQYVQYNWEAFMKSYTGLSLKYKATLDYPSSEETKDDLLDHFSTISVVTRMPEKERQTILRDIRYILDNDPETRDKHLIRLMMHTEIFHYVKQ